LCLKKNKNGGTKRGTMTERKEEVKKWGKEARKERRNIRTNE
jgi:hypothetical protein